MGNKVDNKFTWVIKDFSSLGKKIIHSDEFLVGGCKWSLRAMTGPFDGLFVSLDVADSESLSCGWSRPAKCRITIVNQLSDTLSHREEKQHWFYQKSPSCLLLIFRLTKLQAKDGGFLVNDELKIVAELDFFEVIGKSEESEEATQPLKKIKLENGAKSNNDLLDKTKEGVEVSGFQVLPSQVEFVRRIFEKHPDMALEFRSKSQHLRTSCINVLLTLIETLCQSLQELSNDDLVVADNALKYVKDSGFKVDWLEKKLDEIKRKKKEELMGEIQIGKVEKEMKEIKQRYSNLEAVLEKEKAKVLAARASTLTFDNVL